jgi:hypothetical protein
MKNKTILIYIFALIVGLFILWFIDTVRPKEGFESGSSMNFCPQGWNAFINIDGDTQCCEGSVNGHQCVGKIQCTFGKESADLQSCVALQKKLSVEKSKSICPPSKPNYFENPDGKAGCTDSPLTDSLSGPAGSANTCIIYKDTASNNNDAQSCSNQRLLENTECFGGDCYKSIYVSPLSKTALVQVDFTGVDGIRRSAFEKKSYMNYLNATSPDWKNKIDLDKNINIADVAKAVFVDRSLDIKEAQI